MDSERRRAVAAAAASPEQEQQRTRAVAGAGDFEALYQVLEGLGSVPGGHREYPIQELVARIEKVRAGREDMGRITRTYGIRDKVEELVRHEQLVSHEE